jgi:hypothetical protein
MITVAILINGNPIIARSCHKIEGIEGKCKYKVDDGRIIEHDYNDGAIPLAIKMLEGVIEE